MPRILWLAVLVISAVILGCARQSQPSTAIDSNLQASRGASRRAFR